MKLIQIKEPIWSTRSVGLNVGNINPEEKVLIEILYIEKRTGRKLYPDMYEMSVADILKYPLQTINKHVKVHLVPIAALKKQEENDKSQLSLF